MIEKFNDSSIRSTNIKILARNYNTSSSINNTLVIANNISLCQFLKLKFVKNSLVLKSPERGLSSSITKSLEKYFISIA